MVPPILLGSGDGEARILPVTDRLFDAFINVGRSSSIHERGSSRKPLRRLRLPQITDCATASCSAHNHFAAPRTPSGDFSPSSSARSSSCESVLLCASSRYYSLQTRAHSPRNSAPADRCRIQNSGITVLEKRVHRVETGSLSLSH